MLSKQRVKRKTNERRTVLLTGFNRFGDFLSNPSEKVVLRIRRNPPKGLRLRTLILPTEFYKASRKLTEAITHLKPDYCLSLGVASGDCLRIERIAVNANSAWAPDNAGQMPVDEEIVSSGPPAFWTTMPVSRILRHLQANRIPVAVSYFAGTYVCNHVLYAAIDHVRRNHLPTKVGFIHVPPTRRRGTVNGLPLAVINKGITLVLDELAMDKPEPVS